MSVLERALQDTANTATTGVGVVGLVHLITSALPGPAIERGQVNLRQTRQRLEAEDALPEDLERDYYKEYDQ